LLALVLHGQGLLDATYRASFDALRLIMIVRIQPCQVLAPIDEAAQEMIVLAYLEHSYARNKATWDVICEWRFERPV
jgi:hypothetical protein